MSALKGAAAPIYFGPFLVTPQVFYLTPSTFALVNLKPILPGHVLVSPRRVVPEFQTLLPLKQDGVNAGQSVPHVHCHIIPRKAADLDHRGGTDAIYDMLDGEEGDVGKVFREAAASSERAPTRTKFPVVDDKDRKPRGPEEMKAEAEVLAKEMENEPLD
ncbi:Histidine triad (HIT) protein [Penicillium hetheringtonii]|uniref:Histidine triad (HIT) protein n=1 Tax=Penicillium hetheringtonii TaxID=911720 RepID=A0AAD6H1J6_9EURO|nr:Histidine triad (HIT) protein [Penicillium hetheringtonii]